MKTWHKVGRNEESKNFRRKFRREEKQLLLLQEETRNPGENLFGRVKLEAWLLSHALWEFSSNFPCFILQTIHSLRRRRESEKFKEESFKKAT